MTNNINGINQEIKVNGQKRETVTSFKYLGSIVSDEGSEPEILPRRAQTTVALTRPKPVWNDRSISLSSKVRLMCFLVTPNFLYACESCILTAQLQRRIRATARYYPSRSKTVLPTKKSVPIASGQSNHTKTS